MIVFWLVACLVDRAMVQVPVVHQGGEGSFETEDGIAIELEEAVFQVADFRFEGPANESAWLPSLSTNAWAHPGHGFAGQVGGELLGNFTLDLLDDHELAVADCFEGTYATGRFDLRGEVRLSGQARVDGSWRPFHFVYEADESIRNVPFEGEIAPGEHSASLAIDLQHALSFVDWHTPDDGDGVLTLEDGALANTLPFGVQSTATYTLSLETK